MNDDNCFLQIIKCYNKNQSEQSAWWLQLYVSNKGFFCEECQTSSNQDKWPEQCLNHKQVAA